MSEFINISSTTTDVTTEISNTVDVCRNIINAHENTLTGINNSIHKLGNITTEINNNINMCRNSINAHENTLTGINNSIHELDKVSVLVKNDFYNIKTINIHQIDPEITKPYKINKGDWIDLYAKEDTIIYVNEFKLISLNVSMQLPEGYEAFLAPRSSTFKTWGLIQTNSIGIVDNSYAGYNDIWYLPAYCLVPKADWIMPKDDDPKLFKWLASCKGKFSHWIIKHLYKTRFNSRRYTKVNSGDKIAQFRIVKNAPPVCINFYDKDDNIEIKEDRGGLGSTGTK